MAEFEKRLACVIAADGSIARGYMIESCELKGENEYVINEGALWIELVNAAAAQTKGDR